MLRHSIIVFLTIAGVAYSLADLAPGVTRAQSINWVVTPDRVFSKYATFTINVRLANPCWTMSSLGSDDMVSSYIDECSLIFESGIVKEFASLRQAYAKSVLNRSGNRPKRFVPAFLGGWFLTNLLDSVLETTFPDDHLNTAQINQMYGKLDNLNARTNLSEHMYGKLTEVVGSLDRRLTDTQNALGSLMAQAPKLNIASSFIISKINQHQALIQKIRSGLAGKNVLDVETLGYFLDSEIFDDVDARSIVDVSMESDFWNHIRISFTAKLFDSHSHIFQVHAFKHWVDFSEQPKLLAYIGEPHVVYNSTSDCMRAFRPSSSDFDCLTRGGRLGNYQSWAPISYGSPWENIQPTQVLINPPSILVYCLGRNITIDTRTFECPAYVMCLDPKQAWNTSDHKFDGITHYNINMTAGDLSAYLRLSAIQLPPPVDDETANLRQLVNMTEQVNQLRRESLAFENPIGGGGVSHSTLAKLSISSALLLILAFGYFTWHFGFKSKKRHSKVLGHISDHHSKLQTTLADQLVAAIQSNYTANLSPTDQATKLYPNINDKIKIKPQATKAPIIYTRSISPY